MMSAEEQIPMTFALPRTLNEVDSFDEKECNKNTVSKEFSSSDDEMGPFIKKRSFNFSDSESDSEKETADDISLPKSKLNKSSFTSFEKVTKKSRIKNTNLESDSYSSSEDMRKKIRVEKKYESIRTEDKKKKLKEKFKSLISVQTKNMSELENIIPMSDCPQNASSDEEVSCLNIKEKIKRSLYSIKSVCDPDTSDEETNDESINKHKTNSLRTKSLKPTSPKPIRMSAKQAMENMHKIKSESNRMLREKQVTLPYHRPKALSLKDIVNRRKPGVTSDGKVLPIKMNKEQLEQYVLLLEERQKKMIELCKSDSEQEVDNAKADENVAQVVTHPILEDIIINHNTIDNENDLNYDKINVNEPQSIEFDSQIKTIVELPICEDSKTNFLCETKSNSDRTNEDKILLENPSEIQIDISAQEQESQVINLHYDSERDSHIQNNEQNKIEMNTTESCSERREENFIEIKSSKTEDSLDNILDYHELDRLIKDAEKICENLEQKNKMSDKSFISKTVILPKPKLTGTPGTLINLDNSDLFAQKQLTGVDLLKERFTYFAKLKSLEDMEKDREKKFKPGTQHLKLKLELENQIAEQRSIEWEKRLEQEKILHSEMNNQLSDEDIEKLESKLETTEKEILHDKDAVNESSESEEEPIENDIIMDDKPKKRNPLVDDEAEESDCDEDVAYDGGGSDEKNGKTDDEDSNLEGDDENEEDDDTSESSSQSEQEVETKLKKSRILKAFEDSDDENVEIDNVVQNQGIGSNITVNDSNVLPETEDNEAIKNTLDEELHLAQRNKSSDDLFSTQEADKVLGNDTRKHSESDICGDLGTQTFSILDSVTVNNKVDVSSQKKLVDICETLSQDDANISIIIETCLDSSLQNLESMKSTTGSLSETQEIGDHPAALCTGKFYDNPFISQVDNTENYSPVQLSTYAESQEIGDDVAMLCTGKFYDNPFVNDGIKEPETLEMLNTTQNIKNATTVDVQSDVKSNQEKSILNSILEELDGPDFEKPKNKYFPINKQSKDKPEVHSQLKKRLVIDSDDEINDGIDHIKNKKRKKRKAEQRALQISDDEEEELEVANDDFESENDEERIVEYDSEENEVEVQQKISKKKRVGAFFENEAELTSEDEWVGSGDEDERGLDRMEREEGDDDTFHQGQLRQELGQIHMREVLDQDKREVRLIQELLFEDGDLGDGHRQRKFKWRNADGDEETGTNPDEFLDTQEDEFESEEQWRKQRHEREMYLRKLQEKDDADLDTSVNRTAIIKANICSRSTLIETRTISDKENTVVPEKKTVKDIPSPKKSFTIFQQNYHKSLLTRGRGALARLAALATPLATDNDDAPKVVTTSNRRNFVFTALSQDEQPKVTKRKAENINTPRLIKKMKIDDAHKHYKSTLFDHLKN